MDNCTVCTLVRPFAHDTGSLALLPYFVRGVAVPCGGRAVHRRVGTGVLGDSRECGQEVEWDFEGDVLVAQNTTVIKHYYLFYLLALQLLKT